MHTGRAVVGFFQRQKTSLTKKDEYPDENNAQTSNSLPKEITLNPFTIQAHALQFGDELGEGRTAIVYKGSLGSTVVAIKKISYGIPVRDQPYKTPGEAFQLLHHESSILEKLKPLDCVVKLLGTAYQPDAYSFLLVMEYLPHPEVYKFIKSHSEKNEHSPWGTCYKVMTKTAEALARVHERGIVHNDISYGNVLMQDDGNVKVIDWANGSTLTQDGFVSERDSFATACFLAPERINRRPFGAPADMYSFGSLVFVLAEQVNPLGYVGWTDDDVLYNVAKGKRHPLSPQLPKKVAELIRWC